VKRPMAKKPTPAPNRLMLPKSAYVPRQIVEQRVLAMPENPTPFPRFIQLLVERAKDVPVTADVRWLAGSREFRVMWTRPETDAEKKMRLKFLRARLKGND
jgi:hypothetical protein